MNTKNDKILQKGQSPFPGKENSLHIEQQLLGKKAEEYLRESGKIEDYPSAEDEMDAEASLRQQADND